MTPTPDTTRYERGLAKLAEVDGQAGQRVVDSLGDLGRYIVEFAFGDIYSRPGMSLLVAYPVGIANFSRLLTLPIDF